MSRWPYAYLTGPQKLSKMVDGVHPLHGDYKRVSFEYLGTVTGRFARSEPEFQDLNHGTPAALVDSPLVTADYATIEARILAQMKEDKK